MFEFYKSQTHRVPTGRDVSNSALHEHSFPFYLSTPAPSHGRRRRKEREAREGRDEPQDRSICRKQGALTRCHLPPTGPCGVRAFPACEVFSPPCPLLPPPLIFPRFLPFPSSPRSKTPPLSPSSELSAGAKNGMASFAIERLRRYSQAGLVIPRLPPPLLVLPD